MNKIKSIILSVVFIGTSLMAQSGGEIGYSTIAVQGTAINAGTNYAIIPANSRNGGEPQLTYLNVNGLAAATAITLTGYVSTNQAQATFTNSTTTVYVSNTNGFVAGNWVVIQHLGIPPRFRNEAAIISSVATTNLVLATAPVNTVSPGDIVNQEVVNGTIPIATSATAREISNAGGIISGQRVEPLLITIVSTGAGTNTINVANSIFAP